MSNGCAAVITRLRPYLTSSFKLKIMKQIMLRIGCLIFLIFFLAIKPSSKRDADVIRQMVDVFVHLEYIKWV